MLEAESSKGHEFAFLKPLFLHEYLIMKEQPRISEHKVIDSSQGRSPHSTTKGQVSIYWAHIQPISTRSPDFLRSRYNVFRTERNNAVSNGSLHDHIDICLVKSWFCWYAIVAEYENDV